MACSSGTVFTERIPLERPCCGRSGATGCSIGSVSPVRVDFRLVSATHRRLEEHVKDGNFREDLLARLAGFCIRLPPLRERREDIRLLVAELLASAGAPDSATFSVPAARLLLSHSWSQNARELKRRLNLGVLLAKGIPIGLEQLFPSDEAPPSERADSQTNTIFATPQFDAEDHLRRAELVELLRQHRGNVTAVARALGKARVQVQRWIKRYKNRSSRLLLTFTPIIGVKFSGIQTTGASVGSLSDSSVEPFPTKDAFP